MWSSSWQTESKRKEETMAKTSGGVRGRYTTQIKEARRFYQQERQSAYKSLDSQLREIERRGLTDREYSLLSRNVTFLENNPTFGTSSALTNYINDNRRKAMSGEYDERIMNLSYGLGGEVVRSMAQSAAKRNLLPRLRELLRRYRR